MTKLQQDPPNLSKQNVVEQLGISLPTLDRWVKKHEFPAPIKLGKARNSPTRWRQSVIDRWIGEQQEVAQQ